ncbi:MAG: PAS domain-containing protein [Rubrivivax sp.]|nr:PAS domain-containing protein [Rubrivivax sp.]
MNLETPDDALPVAPTAAPGPRGHPWVIAVGASAGGLEALQRFFGAVQPPTQAAFVVIQHLAPDHRSMMAELLARHTQVPVREAVAGESLEADHIYLMPPGVLMTLEEEHLVFAPRPLQGVSLPVDQFFRSLARSLPERSIGVVLSGSGSDGASGAAALRASGGYVLAQDPATARFDSMPRSAMASTAVDAVLPPEGLAQRAVSLSSGNAARLPGGELVSGTSVKPALQTIFETLRTRAGVDFSQYKLPTVMRRIERRMAVLGCASVSDYALQVESTAEESELLRRELLIPVTGFFRDPLAFEALGLHLKLLLRQQRAQQPLRIWCAGCATGEEAYSLAIVAMEACHEAQNWPGIKVFATDIDPRFLGVASAGAYPVGAAETLTPARLGQHFLLSEERLTVRPELRQSVLFARHNLLEDAPFTKMDVVVCRNTLIYFQAEAQERVMRRLQFALVPGGLLFLGGSESLGALQPDFQVIDQSNKLFRLVRPVLTTLAVRDGFGTSRATSRNAPGALQAAYAAQPPSMVDEGLRSLVQAYVPLTLLVSPSRQLLHAWGPTERYLRVPAGQANLDALRLLPPRLAGVVGYAITQALQQRQTVQATPVALDDDDASLWVQVVVRPLPGDEKLEPCLLVTFEERRVSAQDAPQERPLLAADLDRLAALERELAESRATLQSNIEELEAANEELQATNEELMSSNEELQSTNEELQSVNEELFTVNAEYNAKLDQVNALHADLEGMSQATGIATVFVSDSLALLRFTPEAALLFRLRVSDIGRSLTDFNPQIDYPGLIEDLRAALDGLHPREREVSGPGSTRFLVRVIGYGDRSLGTRRAVLSVIDVSRLHDARRLQALIDSLPEHVALLNEQGTIVQVNQAWSGFARDNGASDASVGPGVNYLAVLARSTNPDAADILRGVQRVLAGTQDALRLTYPCHAPDRKRWFVMHVSPLRAASAAGLRSSEPGAVVTHLEITPWWSDAQGDAQSGTLGGNQGEARPGHD